MLKWQEHPQSPDRTIPICYILTIDNRVNFENSFWAYHIVLVWVIVCVLIDLCFLFCVFLVLINLGFHIVNWLNMLVGTTTPSLPLLYYIHPVYLQEFHQLSMLSCCQRGCHLLLHVVWLVWDTVLMKGKWLFVMLVVGINRDSRKWSYGVARVEGRLGWLGVGLVWLMDVIVDDGPVTEVVIREESGEFISTTGCSHL